MVEIEDTVNTPELARRATECKRWFWEYGIRYADHPSTEMWRVAFCNNGDLFSVSYTGKIDFTRNHWYGLPDLKDQATVMAILLVVRRAYRDEKISVNYETDRETWIVWKGKDVIGEGRTEAEALVVALEAAPPYSRKQELKDLQ